MDFQAELMRTLSAVVSSQDSAVIMQATQSLTATFYSVPDCIPALLAITLSDNQQLRQLAIVEMRKRCTKKMWNRLTVDTKSQIKTSLMHAVLSEQDVKIRHAMARVIASISRVDQWPDLFSAVNEWCRSPVQAHREIAFFLVLSLLDAMPDSFTQNISHLFALYANSLKDQSVDVRVYTVEGLGKLAELIEPGDEVALKGFRTLLPDLMAVVQTLIDLRDDARCMSVIETIIELVTLEVPVLAKHFTQTIEFFLGIAASSAEKPVSEQIRNQALTLIMFAAVYKKNALTKSKMVTPLTHRLMCIGAEPEPEDMDDEVPARTAFRVLHTLATNVPPQQIFPVTWDTVTSFSQNQQNAGFRKSAMLALAAIAEGCSDYIRNEFKLANYLPVIVNGLKDPDLSVRRAACLAVDAIAAEVGSEIAEFHAELLPLVFAQLSDSNERIRKVSLQTLDSLLEHMGDAIKPYLPDLMEHLVALLDSADMEVKTTIIGAIGSAAHASESSFQPYFPAVISRLEQCMTLVDKDDEDQMLLRGAATDAAGTIALAVGKEMFYPHLTRFMDLAMQGVSIGVSHLAESGHFFFGIMARLNKQDFGSYLGPVMAKLFQSCMIVEKNLDEIDEDEEVVDHDDDDGDDEYLSGYTINNAIAEEKEMALQTFGVLFESTTQQFAPYLTKTIELVQEMCDHSHEAVRRGCHTTLAKILSAMFDMYHSAVEWKPGQVFEVHGDVKEMITIIMSESIRTLEDDEDKSVVYTVLSELTEVLKKCGPVMLDQNRLEALSFHIMNLITKKAACQTADSDEAGNEEDDDQPEYDALIISSAIDLVGTLALVAGSPFSSYFTHLWPHIAKFFKPNKPVSDRSMVAGVIGEVSSGLGSEITPFTAQMMQITMRGMQDEDEEVRSNSAFSTGMICFNSKMDGMGAEYLNILTVMYPLFQDAHPTVVDNSCSAVCRMIMARPGDVPIDQVIPVLVKCLPLKRDQVENKPVFECFTSLLDANHPSVVSVAGYLAKMYCELLAGNQDFGSSENAVKMFVKKCCYDGLHHPTEEQRALLT